MDQVGKPGDATGLLRALLPACVAVRATRNLLTLDEAQAVLLGAEAQVMSRAVPRRVQEFATARACARSALAELGLAAQPILPGRDRAPQWPAGVVGSITHCDGFYAAAVADTSSLIHLGIDAEPNATLPTGVADVVTLPVEREYLKLLDRHGDAAWGRLLLSAKEAVFKAAFPADRQWRGFQDVVVGLDPDGTYTATAVAGGSLSALLGRWRVSDGIVVTAAFDRRRESLLGNRGVLTQTAPRTPTD